jgi:CHRD domain
LNGRVKLVILTALAAVLAVVGTTAIAGGGRDIRERLSGYEEDPAPISTPGEGKFRAQIDKKGQKIFYRLRYADLEGNILQAHIHFGGRAQSGGIIAFLCSNLGNGPAGTPECPAAPGSVSGTIDPADVRAIANQSVAEGDFDALVDAIRAGATYANVHTSAWPAGEIRAQLDDDKRKHDDD